jgi:single-strand DNA-binding protein
LFCYKEAINMMNVVILEANLVDTPELRYTAQGTPVATMRVANNSKYKSGDEWKEDVVFIDVTVWGKQGEAVSQHLDKGSKALIQGRLKQESWEKDGKKHSKISITATSVRFLDSKDSVPSEHTEVEPF